MTNINETLVQSQAGFEIPAKILVLDAIEDLVFDFANMNSGINYGQCKLESIEFLRQHPKIKYANETYDALKACHTLLRGVTAGAFSLNQIVDVYTDIKNVLNKIEVA